VTVFRRGVPPYKTRLKTSNRWDQEAKKNKKGKKRNKKFSSTGRSEEDRRQKGKKEET